MTTDSIKNTIRFSTLLLVFSLITTICSAMPIHEIEPIEGDFCFSSRNDRYIQMHVVNNVVEGKIFVFDDYEGEVFYDFTGSCDTSGLIQVSINYSESGEPAKEKWKLNLKDHSMSVLENYLNSPNEEYKSLDCDNFPDTSEYVSLSETSENEPDLSAENPTSLCFHMYDPEGGSRVRVSEYINVSFRDNSVFGSAAGFSEGDGNWGMRFQGTALNDSIYLITCTYTDAAGTLHLTSEQWKFDEAKTSLTVLGVTPNNFRNPGNPFHSIECKNLPDWANELMY